MIFNSRFDLFEIPKAAVWTSMIVLWLLVVLQLSGNGVIIYILIFTTERTQANNFILSLAFSDFLSGLGSIIGAHREEIGTIYFSLPSG